MASTAAAVDNTLPANAIVENAKVLEPKKYTFLHASPGGRHMEPEVVRGEDGRPVCLPVIGAGDRPLEKDGKPVMRVQVKDVAYGKNCPAGDIFQCNQELDKIHNRKGQPPKFQRLDGERDPHLFEAHAEKERADRLAAEKQRLLGMMSREQLQEYAEQVLGIDLKNKSKREAILAEIVKHEAEAVAA